MNNNQLTHSLISTVKVKRWLPEHSLHRLSLTAEGRTLTARWRAAIGGSILWTNISSSVVTESRSCQQPSHYVMTRPQVNKAEIYTSLFISLFQSSWSCTSRSLHRANTLPLLNLSKLELMPSTGFSHDFCVNMFSFISYVHFLDPTKKYTNLCVNCCCNMQISQLETNKVHLVLRS